MNNPKALIVLPRLQVQNANAISGPMTWGFPSPTAFSGFVHALERKLSDELEQGFGGVGIICHHFEPQISQPSGKRNQVFNLTRNPLGKDGKSTAIVEEGRAHMEVSLVIALHDHLGDEEDANDFLNSLSEILHTLRLAGGSLLPKRAGKRYNPQYWPLDKDQTSQDKIFTKLRRQLLPGFALVQREDKLQQHLSSMQKIDEEANALDALLDLSRLNFEPNIPHPEKPDETQWGIRKNAGWLVPVPNGYAAISPLYSPGEVQNSRDNESPFHFVESLYTLGEWLSPHRLTSLQQLLWHPKTDLDNGLYCCVNHYIDNQHTAVNGNT